MTDTMDWTDEIDNSEETAEETAEARPTRTPRRRHDVNYSFDVLDELPENARAAEKRGQPGWRGRFDELTAAYQNGTLPRGDDGRSRWVVLAQYGNKAGAANALNAIKKRQAAAADDANVEPAVPPAWAVEIETRRPAGGGSILAARCWPKS